MGYRKRGPKPKHLLIQVRINPDWILTRDTVLTLFLTSHVCLCVIYLRQQERLGYRGLTFYTFYSVLILALLICMAFCQKKAYKLRQLSLIFPIKILGTI